MLHHSGPYDPTLRNFNINGRLNYKGVYNNFVTWNNMSDLHCYHILKKGEARNDYKSKTVCFWSKRFYKTFTQTLGLEAQFESSDDESDTKYYRTKKTNIKRR